MSRGEDDRQRARTPSFEALLREPPHVDDFLDATDLRYEPPCETDLE